MDERVSDSVDEELDRRIPQEAKEVSKTEALGRRRTRLLRSSAMSGRRLFVQRHSCNDQTTGAERRQDSKGRIADESRNALKMVVLMARFGGIADLFFV